MVYLRRPSWSPDFVAEVQARLLQSFLHREAEQWAAYFAMRHRWWMLEHRVR